MTKHMHEVKAVSIVGAVLIALILLNTLTASRKLSPQQRQNLCGMMSNASRLVEVSKVTSKSDNNRLAAACRAKGQIETVRAIMDDKQIRSSCGHDAANMISQIESIEQLILRAPTTLHRRGRRKKKRPSTQLAAQFGRYGF